jgi:hypothetical protein
MALTDINFSESEAQDFLVELPNGSSHPVVDILIESSSTQYLVLERPQARSSIFIMSE